MSLDEVHAAIVAAQAAYDETRAALQRAQEAHMASTRALSEAQRAFDDEVKGLRSGAPPRQRLGRTEHAQGEAMTEATTPRPTSLRRPRDPRHARPRRPAWGRDDHVRARPSRPHQDDRVSLA